MTCNIGLILDAYHSLSKTDSPKITEEFMNKMLEHEKALNMLECCSPVRLSIASPDAMP